MANGETALIAAAAGWSLAGAVWDVHSRRIPNALSYSGILAGIVLRASLLGWRGAGMAVVGGLLAGGLFFVLYVVRAMGAGDVKLMAAVGCFTGPVAALQIMIVCAFAGGLMALAILVYQRSMAAGFRNVGRLLKFHATHGAEVHPTLNIDNPQSTRLPYAVAIAAGAVYQLAATIASR